VLVLLRYQQTRPFVAHCVQPELDHKHHPLPIPRLVYLLADMTVWLAVVLPGVVFAVIIGSIRFGLDLQISPLVVPAVVLVALTATSIGYALASLVPPMIANMASQVLVVFTLMFSPLNFPADRLPGWLAAIHSVLPIQPMGE
jgi:ABC-2 type transport system permease protein